MSKKTVKQFRRYLGWTQMEMASHLGCTQGVISAWENGRCIPGNHLFAGLRDWMGEYGFELKLVWMNEE